MIHRQLLLLVLALTLVGCVKVGHRAIQGSRTDYNVAIARTADEQLLLNLVRLRYRDRPLFLEVSSLATQFSYAPSVDASLSGGGSEVTEQLGIGGRVAFEERPTVSYTPLQGADYVERMLAAIPVETLVLLDASGWSTERLFRTCLQRMNGLDNASSAAGPTPAQAPQYADFRRAARLLRELELVGGVEGGRKDEEIVLRFAPRAREAEAFEPLARLLGLDPSKESFHLAARADEGGGERISVHTRSFSGVLYFLSQAVEVPEADLAAGRVTQTLDASGQPFDWSEVTGGLLRVRSSSREPTDAAVRVRYRGSWFYIDDADLDSKSTFSLLAQLYALQAGGARGTAPLLTLPI